MSSPNPLIPQGSLLEQQAKSKSTFHVAALIVGLHVFLLGGLLIIGCKREEPKPVEPPVTDTLSQPLITETNLVDPALVGGAPTNLLAQPSTNPIPPVTFEQPISPVAPPPVEPAVHETAGGPTSEYVVKKGDIAGRIASRNKVTLKQLQEANPGVDLAKLKVNQKINLPAGAAAPATPPAAQETAPQAASETITYTVKGGDTLTKLAKVHGTTIKAIRQASGLKSNDLKVGQKIKIPSKAAAPAPAAPAPEPVAPPVVSPAPLLPTATPIAAPVSPAPIGTPR
jgi:LysM repeat protein